MPRIAKNRMALRLLSAPQRALGVSEWLKSDPYPSASAEIFLVHSNVIVLRMLFFVTSFVSCTRITGDVSIRFPLRICLVAYTPRPLLLGRTLKRDESIAYDFGRWRSRDHNPVRFTVFTAAPRAFDTLRRS